MSTITKSIGGLSTGLLLLNFLYYDNKIKDVEKTRVKIEQALANIEGQPEGAETIAQISKELQSLETTKYGHTTFKEIHEKLNKLENESTKTREIKTSEILSSAAQNANMETAVDTTKLVGAMGLTGAGASLLIAPLIGNLLVILLFGSEERVDKKKHSGFYDKPDDAKSHWLKNLLTHNITGRGLRPSEQKVFDELERKKSSNAKLRKKPLGPTGTQRLR